MPQIHALPKRALLAATALALLAPAPIMAEELPLKRVILSTAGLAHFEHWGPVDGATQIDLPVRLDQVDDLMKSLVVFDAKGQLGGVSVPGRTPLEHIFRDMPFDRHAISNPVGLLNALAGVDVSIDGQRKMTGILVSVRGEEQILDRRTIERHRVTIMGDEGLQSTLLEDLSALKFNDPTVQDQVKRGLKALYENRVQDKRNLAIDLRGEGKRDVALSYVVEAPLWKSAYRLVLPKDGEDKAMLQGWAVLENMTGSDWQDVDITLISGNPVTYRQSLYESYIAPRPQLPVTVMGRIMPKLDTGSLGKASDIELARMDQEERIKYEMRQAMINDPRLGFAALGGIGFDQSGNMMPTPDNGQSSLFNFVAPKTMAGQIPGQPAPPPTTDMRFAQAQTALASDVPTQILFRFPLLQSVANGHSLMLPFASTEIPAKRVWLYQPETHDKHPLASIRLENTSGAGLPPGILTLYQPGPAGTAYVGDAQMPMVPKSEDRMISYALDANTLIDREARDFSTVTEVAISKGIMRIASKNISTTNYSIKTASDEPRQITIEHPRREGWTLVGNNKNVELTTSHYRITIDVPADTSISYTVSLERMGRQQFSLNGDSQHAIYARIGDYAASSPKIKAAFTKITDLKQNLDSIKSMRQSLKSDRLAILKDMELQRKTYTTFGDKTDIGQRILKEMNDQMDKIEALRTRDAELKTEEDAAEAALKDYISKLEI